MEKFRWAYIGSGNIAKSTAKSIEKGAHEIVAVYSRTFSKAEAFAKKHGARAYKNAEEAISAENVDAVYIATPHTSHIDYSLEAIKLGKPVLCEKPVGVTAEEAEEMINVAKENGIYYCEAMWTWFSDVALTVKKWVDEKRIGEIKNVVINYAFPGLMMSKNSRVLTPETAGGALLDVGIYPITYCYRLFGFPEKISCTGTIKNGIDTDETVVLEYGGFKCTLKMSLAKLKEDCIIEGTKGSITLPMFHMAWKAVLNSDGKKEVFKGKTDYLTEFTAVANEIKNGKTESDFIPFEATVNVMKIIDECREQLGLKYPFEK